MLAMIPSKSDLVAAYSVTRKVTERTPLLESPALAKACGATRVFIKAESLQKAGSFKIRGATWRLHALSAAERARGVVAYSSGNFAQGLAAAGQAAGVPVTIVMPIDAPEVKRRATEGYGARVILSDHGSGPREEVASALAREVAERDGLALLHPFDDPLIVAGQAGAGLEALEQLAEKGVTPDVIACPVGGGGLMGGLSLACRYALPDVRIFGIEPEGYDGLGASLGAGQATRVASNRRTICDALQATQPGSSPFLSAQFAGVKGLTVTDAAVRAALRQAFEHLKLVLEPSGAVAIAALLQGALPVKGRVAMVVATGGNIAMTDFLTLMKE